ncbi:MAG: malto-oligosyltrehalose synthase [Halofilum sp. (in: g-proteobacteria)]
MTDPELLAELADLRGIARGYRDIRGREREAPGATRQALLAAMGLDVSSDAAIRACIAEHRARPWRRTLPPVVVVRDRQPMHVPLVIDNAALDARHEWRVQTESGHLHIGNFVPRELGEQAREPTDVAGGGAPRRRLLLALPLDPGLGYHDLTIDPPAGPPANTRLIVSPPTCHVPPRIAAGQRVWGLAIQLYSLRSREDWGIGDFTALAELAEGARRLGADVIGLNPLHALYPHHPEEHGPYAPSSRLFLNILYIDPAAVPELARAPRARALMEAPDFHERLQAARAAELVDYRAVAELKRPVLEALFAVFRRQHLGSGSARGRAFDAFRAEYGPALHRHAVFEALAESLEPGTGEAGPGWPAEFRDPDSSAVARFARRHADRVAFFEYLQWLADEQLAHAARSARDEGLSIGLYRDLAISAAGHGSEVWASGGLHARGASIGSPPDDFNPHGQDWGLPPLIPERLVESAYEPFIATLRRNMRHAGALRIDHVMGLMRLFWVPDGQSAEDGAYVHYPMSDLLGILALESRRNRCMVIGEDLGTVPDEVRTALGPAEVQSYRVLYFEREHDGAFRPPADYPERALATVATHDLPPLAGFWAGHDLLLRAELDLFPSDELRVSQLGQRGGDRAALLSALQREELLPPDGERDPGAIPYLDGALRRAVHRYVARAPSRVLMVQPEDVLGQREQVNLPGTTDQHPNWRRRYPLSVCEFATDAEFRATADTLAAEGRGRPAEVPVPPSDARAAPRATYRLQLGPGFTLQDARARVPYFEALGVSHCYLSPVLQARSGSTHGYDVVDHGAIDRDIGTRADFEALADALHARGMGLILDLVPNHMGVMGTDNAWWLDVLENGPASEFAPYFDIDWQPARRELAGRVLLPVLGDHYGVVLESGALQLALDDDARGFAVHYHEHRFPLDPGTWPYLLRFWHERLEDTLADDPAALEKLETVAQALGGLPPRSVAEEELRAERRRIANESRARLAHLCATRPAIREHLDTVCTFFNGLVDEPSTFEPMHDLLERQAWRLAHWRVAGDEINYRRFFDINDLAGLSTHREEVFEATHRLVLDLRANGHLDGVRIDHPDGLYEPRTYLRRLARALEARRPPDALPTYRVVEKILTGDEGLRADWPVHGTTGYGFANLVGRLFVDPDGERALTSTYHRFIGRRVSFAGESYHARHLIMHRQMAAELATLAHRLDRLSELDWNTRDFTHHGLRDGLAEVIACFPVYRTYIVGGRVSAADRAVIERAVEAAVSTPRTDPDVLAFIRDVLLLQPGSALVESRRPDLTDFVLRFQQYTSALMAKGIEDTALYRHYRLSSLNEVGGSPDDFAAEPTRVHRALGAQARAWPHGMLNTATHDAKRGEDVRMRVHALSEIPGEWRAATMRWRRLNRRHGRDVGGKRAPVADDEYLFYQTLIGAWPPCLQTPDTGFVERIRAYMIKAAREAKRATSWWRPEPAYEQALEAFVEGALADRRFLAELAPMRARVDRLGRINSLAQCLLKLTVPGVPDLYQGSEGWQLALVDPDNRRPVDFERLDSGLAAVQSLERAAAAERRERLLALADGDPEGLAKQFLVRRVLRTRAAVDPVFREGRYEPLDTAGEHAHRVFAFARVSSEGVAVVAVPRLAGGLSDGGRSALGAEAWGDTRVCVPEELQPSSGLADAFTGLPVSTAKADGGDCVSCRDIFAVFPGALLVPRTLRV